MHPYPGLFWTGLIIGGLLGYVAARIRLSNSPLEGQRWVAALGAVAGGITGLVVASGLALATAVFDYSLNRRDDWALLGPTILILLLLFVGFSLRPQK